MIDLDKFFINWLDVQARALFQAEILIESTIRDFAYQYFNRYNKQ